MGRQASYVLAGVDTFASLIDRFINDFPGYLKHENVDNFIQNSVGKFLFSYGTGLNYKTKRIAKNYSEKMIKSIRKFNQVKFMKNSTIYLDSGGFQVSMGAIPSKDIPGFIDMYYEFINDYHEDFSHAFLLDIPPGPGTTEAGIFKSYKEIYELNKSSYERANQLPMEVKQNKLIYIHHFRTPQIYNVWRKLLLDDNLGVDYNYYATGGLVAFGASDISIPAILYCIPLSTIIQYCKTTGKKAFKFHVLGGANFIDVLHHRLFSKHIKEFHGIDCEITYDSSSIFKGAFNGRYISVFNDDKNLMKMSFKSNELHLRFDKTGTVNDKMFSLLNRIADVYKLTKLSDEKESVYSEETGTLSKPISIYIMLYVLQLYKDVEDFANDLSDELYDIYKSGNMNEFTRRVTEITKSFNQGKMTRKQKSKSFSIWNSMQMIEKLDEEHNEYIINKFMSGGDSGTLDEGGCIKF
jgi:hypothetical protein